MGPNALTQCLFNHNLGLHENANRKQTRLPGRRRRRRGMEMEKRGRGGDGLGGMRGMGGCEEEELVWVTGEDRRRERKRQDNMKNGR